MDIEKTENIVIIGGGGFGREVQWLIERINVEEQSKTGLKKWNLIGFIDDGIPQGERINELPVLGDCGWLLNWKEKIAVVCAIGSTHIRKRIISRILQNSNISFPNLIDPSVLLSKSIQFGMGNIVCAGTILTVDIKLKDFCIINLDCTVGHDVNLGSFVTLYPSVNLSGCIKVEDAVEIGTGSHAIQGIKVGSRTIIGAGTVIIRDLPSECTAVGNPAKVIKQEKNEETRRKHSLKNREI